MTNKAQKIGRKRQLRKLKATNNLKKHRDMQIGYHRLISGVKKTEKLKKQIQPVKPYRLAKFQAKHDKIYQSIRALGVNDPERDKLLVELSIIKKKLGQ